MNSSDQPAVGTVDELAPGQRKLAFVDGRSIVLFNIDGTIHAIDNAWSSQRGLASKRSAGGMRAALPGARSALRSAHWLHAGRRRIEPDNFPGPDHRRKAGRETRRSGHQSCAGTGVQCRTVIGAAREHSVNQGNKDARLNDAATATGCVTAHAR